MGVGSKFGGWLVVALCIFSLIGGASAQSRMVIEENPSGLATTEPDAVIAPQVDPDDVNEAAAVLQMQQAREAPSNIDEYVLGPHDLLEITVFQVEELSRTVRVNSRGTFALPLIGTIQAVGATSAEVEAEIAKRLAVCCMQDPQVSIFIKEFVSQRVTVDGEVEKPGVYAITGRTTLLQALAMASGSGQLADLSEVRVFRDLKDGTKEQLVFDIAQIREGKMIDPQLQGNDIVVVGKSGSLTVIKGVTDTLRGFIGFGSVR